MVRQEGEHYYNSRKISMEVSFQPYQQQEEEEDGQDDFVILEHPTDERLVSVEATTVLPKPPSQESINNIDPSDQLRIDWRGLTLVFLAPALGGFLYGYDIGATSFSLQAMRDTRDHDVWWFHLSTVKQGWIVSLLALGAMLGSHIVYLWSATISRRKELRIAASLYIVGATLNVMSGTYFRFSDISGNRGLFCLLLGRLLYGCGVGCLMHSAPSYLAEMSPTQIRGAMVSAKETVIVFGIVVGMLMGDLMIDDFSGNSNWTDLYGMSILGAVPMLLLTFQIPRSKRWLILKGYTDEAKQSMQFVYSGNIEDEFERIVTGVCGGLASQKKQQADSSSANGMTVASCSVVDNADKEADPDQIPQNDIIEETNNQSTMACSSLASKNEPDLLSPEYRPIMLVGLGLLVAQQCSGQPSVLAYSRVLFAAAGLQGHTSVITVILMAMTSACTVALVDKLGRKMLLSMGCLVMSASLVCLAYGFWGWNSEMVLFGGGTPKWCWICFNGMLFYGVCSRLFRLIKLDTGL